MAKKSKTYDNVVSVLDANRISPMSGVSPRDSDTELIIQMMQLVHGAGLDERQLMILRSMNFESITRCRRKLQEEGKFLPSPEVARRRRLKGYIVEQQAPELDAPNITHLLEAAVA